MKAIKELIQYITLIGVEGHPDERISRKIKLTNTIVLLACTMSLVQAVAMIKIPAYSLLCLVSILVYAGTFVLNGLHHWNTSRVYFNLISCVVILIATGGLTEETNIAYRFMLIQAFVIPMIVFDFSETRFQIVGVLAFLTSFVAFDTVVAATPLFEGIDPSLFDGKEMIVTNGVLCMVTLMLGSRYLQKVNLEQEQTLVEEITHRDLQIAMLNNAGESVKESIRYADQIQKGLLPEFSKIAQTLPDHAILRQEAQDSSGDFYWYEEVNGHIVIATFESKGFRTTEVMMSMIIGMTLDRFVTEQGNTSPKEIMSYMGLELERILKDEWNTLHKCVEMSVCSIDVERSMVKFAGTIDSLILRKDEELVRPIVTTQNERNDTNGAICSFFQHELPLAKENRLYLSTSGIESQFAEHKAKRNEDLSVLTTLLNNKNYSLELQMNCIQQAVMRSLSSQETQKEDILVMAFDFNRETLKHNVRAKQMSAERTMQSISAS